MVKSAKVRAALFSTGVATIRQQRQGSMISPDQLRAARALLRWSRAELAKRAKVALPTISQIEQQASDPKVSTLIKLRDALQVGGVIFVDADDIGGPGVRFRKRR